MVGSGCAALPETVELSNYALERGADALLIVPPFYFKDISDEGLLAYYESVLAELPAGARVFLYNIPKFSGVAISHALLDGLLQRFPDRLAGLKDTSGKLPTLQGYLQRYPSLSVFSGSDALAAEGHRLGAVGCISGVANVFPDLMGARPRPAPNRSAMRLRPPSTASAGSRTAIPHPACSSTCCASSAASPRPTCDRPCAT